MTLGFPEELGWVSVLVGMEWPEGDEDSLRRIGNAWETAAQELLALAPSMQDAATTTSKSIEGVAGDVIRKAMQDITYGDYSLDKLAEAAETAAQMSRDSATQIEYTKYSFYAALILLAAQIAYFLAMAAITWGVSLSGIPIAIAAVRTAVIAGLRQLISAIASATAKKVALEMLKRGAFGAAFSAALGAAQDAAIQTIQHRFDAGQFWESTTQGAISGGVGGLGGGLVSGSLGQRVVAGGNPLSDLSSRSVRWGNEMIAGTVEGAFGGLYGATYSAFGGNGFSWREITAGGASGAFSPGGRDRTSTGTGADTPPAPNVDAGSSDTGSTNQTNGAAPNRSTESSSTTTESTPTATGSSPTDSTSNSSESTTLSGTDRSTPDTHTAGEPPGETTSATDPSATTTNSATPSAPDTPIAETVSSNPSETQTTGPPSDPAEAAQPPATDSGHTPPSEHSPQPTDPTPSHAPSAETSSTTSHTDSTQTHPTGDSATPPRDSTAPTGTHETTPTDQAGSHNTTQSGAPAGGGPIAAVSGAAPTTPGSHVPGQSSPGATNSPGTSGGPEAPPRPAPQSGDRALSTPPEPTRPADGNRTAEPSRSAPATPRAVPEHPGATPPARADTAPVVRNAETAAAPPGTSGKAPDSSLAAATSAAALITSDSATRSPSGDRVRPSRAALFGASPDAPHTPDPGGGGRPPTDPPQRGDRPGDGTDPTDGDSENRKYLAGEPPRDATAAEQAAAREALAQRDPAVTGPSDLLPPDHGGDVTARAREVAAENGRWWHGLTTEQQDGLIRTHPREIGNADGLPAASRDHANRISIDQDLAQPSSDLPGGLRKVLQWLRNGPDTPNGLRNNLESIFKAVRLAEDNATSLPPDTDGNTPRVQVLSVDSRAFGGEGRAVVSIGDLDTAQSVSWHVPGLTTTIRSLRLNLNNATDHYRSIVNRSDPPTVASVAWLGYDAPSGRGFLSVARSALAEAGGNLLARDIAGFNAGRDLSDAGRPDNHVFGHSYGSTTTSFAGASQHPDGPGRLASEVRTITLLGSPGAGPVTHASQFGLGDNVFAASSSRDPVTWPGSSHPDGTGRFGPGLGVDPSVESFGARRISAEADTHRTKNILTHTGYYRTTSEALGNFGRIAAGEIPEVAPHRPNAGLERSLHPVDDPEANRNAIPKSTRDMVDTDSDPVPGPPHTLDTTPTSLADMRSWLPLLNPDDGTPGRTNNCIQSVRAFLDTITGNAHEAPPHSDPTSPGTSLSDLEASVGSHTSEATFTDVAAHLREMPDGSMAVVATTFHHENGQPAAGHAYLAINDGGTIRFVDPQTGRIGGWPPYFTNTPHAVSDVAFLHPDATPETPLTRNAGDHTTAHPRPDMFAGDDTPPVNHTEADDSVPRTRDGDNDVDTSQGDQESRAEATRERAVSAIDDARNAQIEARRAERELRDAEAHGNTDEITHARQRWEELKTKADDLARQVQAVVDRHYFERANGTQLVRRPRFESEGYPLLRPGTDGLPVVADDVPNGDVPDRVVREPAGDRADRIDLYAVADADVLRDGSHLNPDGSLKPNTIYEAGEYRYRFRTDSEGHIVQFQANELRLTERAERLPHQAETIGKLPGDHAGHLAGDRFGGSQWLDNIVSQLSAVNLSEYKVIENAWAAALDPNQPGGPRPVTVDVQVHNDATGRPTHFVVKSIIDGRMTTKELTN